MSEENSKFCNICGGHHPKGKCPPENFAHLKCNKCHKVIDMPWDAALMGLTGIMCGCGAEDYFHHVD